MGAVRKQATANPGAITPASGVDLDIFGIREFWEDAKDWVLSAEGPALRVDLSEVGDLDLSGLQVLVAVDLALQEKGFALELLGAHPDWIQRMQWLGFEHLHSSCILERE